MSSERAVSPVIGVVLLVAIVVILAATLGALVLDIGRKAQEPVPRVAGTTGELRADVAGSDDQHVRIVHQSGDAVPVQDIEIAVDARAACGAEARLVDFPTTTLDGANVDGDDIFDSTSPDGGALDTTTDGEWNAGETLQFRIANTECSLDVGDTVTVRVVHVPSGGILVTTEIQAT